MAPFLGEKKLILTDFLEHFVALIENEDLKVGKIEIASLYEGKDSSWGSNDDVGLLDTLEEGDVLLNGNTTVDNFGSDVGELGLESNELLLDLIGKLSVVAEDKS